MKVWGGANAQIVGKRGVAPVRLTRRRLAAECAWRDEVKEQEGDYASPPTR
jgi:hypothetical protein